MGTNFYWKAGGGHIGKRSAAGIYCYACERTLCKGGEEYLHSGRYDFYDTCPSCGKAPSNVYRTVTLRVGTLTIRAEQPKGVGYAPSWTWAEAPGMVKRKLQRGAKVVDEYGHEYSAAEFYGEYEVCPIVFKHSISVQFS